MEVETLYDVMNVFRDKAYEGMFEQCSLNSGTETR